MTLFRQRAEEIFEKVLKCSTAEETEAAISLTSYALTRFANNAIHQNVMEETVALAVRVVTAGRMASASTNKLDDASIRQLCERALALARVQPLDPDLLLMPGAQTYSAVDRFDKETAELTPRARAEVVAQVIARAARDHLTAAGVFASGSTALALLNSRGLAAHHEETLAQFSVTMLGESSSGWAKRTSARWAELEPLQLADRAAQKALASCAPRETPPGKYPVILEPAAVLDLLGFLVLDFSGLAVHEQRSCFTDRVGKEVFGENISIRDDVYHPLQAGAPFDGEGVPRQRVLLVEKGEVKNLVYARQTAHKVGAQPTGHGLPLPNEFGEAPLNIVMEGGHASLEEMIRSTPCGLLVTRFWYIREVDPYEKILTGMTRDGTFWIKDGQVRYGVKNLRFNQSLTEMLARVEMMSPHQRTAGEESFEMVVPAMKVQEFNFSSLTKY
jgi:predicted Zn-dependent protease